MVAGFIATAPLPVVAALVFAVFSAMYFGMAGAVAYWTRRLPRPAPGVRPRVATSTEIRRSLRSIGVFALYGVLTVLLIRTGWLTIALDLALLSIVRDAVILVLWNEVHFYVCHRLLHTRVLMRVAHYQHHQSVTPSPYTAFSFHPFEAVMLGSVMVLAMPWHTFNVFALLFLPVWSLAWNVLGHCGVARLPGAAISRLFTESVRRHDAHHARPAANFGFVFRFMDDLGGTGEGASGSRS